MSDDRVPVCDADRLADGDRTIVEVGGREVGVFNIDGELYALQNTCPHRSGPVCEGKVTAALVGRWPGVGERLDEQMTGDPAIACPWHGWEFDLETGTHLGDDRYGVPTFEVVVDDGVVYVEP
jgi:nitrite reductase/ring-hydroxylating ferredoxin subunit